VLCEYLRQEFPLWQTIKGYFIVLYCHLPILEKDRFVSGLAPVWPGIFKLVKKCNLFRNF